MSVENTRAKILEKLNDMQKLKAAYNWETSNVSGNYPYATLTLREGHGEYGSSSHNLRMRGFRVRIYQERSKTGQGPQTAEEIATKVLDEIETAFDMDTTLSGAVKYTLPASWVAEYVDRELDTRVLTINLDAYELVSSQ